MTRKTIGHIFSTTPSFVHHYKSISEFKLELQSGSTQFGSKLVILFVSCDHEIWWMTSENNWAPLLYYFKLCAWFQSHRFIQTGVTVRKHSILVKIGDFCSVWPWNLMDDFKNNRAPLLYYVKLCASFQSHQCIQASITVRKCSIRVKIRIFVGTCDLEIWRITLKNHRAPLLCCFNLCVSFCSHWWIQTGATIRKSKWTIF